MSAVLGGFWAGFAFCFWGGFAFCFLLLACFLVWTVFWAGFAGFAFCFWAGFAFCFLLLACFLVWTVFSAVLGGFLLALDVVSACIFHCALRLLLSLTAIFAFCFAEQPVEIDYAENPCMELNLLPLRSCGSAALCDRRCS